MFMFSGYPPCKKGIAPPLARRDPSGKTFCYEE
jgi:hypothetical protein